MILAPRKFNFGWRTLEEQLLRLLDGCGGEIFKIWGRARPACWCSSSYKELSPLSGHSLAQWPSLSSRKFHQIIPSQNICPEFCARLESGFCINTFSKLWLSFSFSAKIQRQLNSIKVLIQYQVNGSKMDFPTEPSLRYFAGFTFSGRKVEVQLIKEDLRKKFPKWKSAERYWIGSKLGIGFSQPM